MSQMFQSPLKCQKCCEDFENVARCCEDFKNVAIATDPFKMLQMLWIL